jgi:prolipoprotein diacylglyceryltransferase
MINENWGLRPILFYIGGFPVKAYPVFIFLALVTGILVYIIQLRRDKIQKSNALYIAIFAIVGGTIGSKIPIIIMYWNQLNSGHYSVNILLSGRTIIGGLIGGAVGTFLSKKILG